MTGFRVTASADHLIKQASDTAYCYLRRAVSDIDEVLGAGYAAKHPELVAAIVASATADYATANRAGQTGEMLDRLNELATELLGDDPASPLGVLLSEALDMAIKRNREGAA